MAINQLIGSVRQLEQYWHSEESEVDTESNSIEACENFVFKMLRAAAKVLTLLTVSKSFLAVQANLFYAYFCKAPEDIHYCYNAKFANDSKSFYSLGSIGPWASLSLGAIRNVNGQSLLYFP